MSMKLEKQYPRGTQVQGAFHSILFHAMVIGYQEAFPDQEGCVDVEVLHPHPDLPVHRIAVYSSALNYHIYENSLCIDPIESKLTRINAHGPQRDVCR